MNNLTVITQSTNISSDARPMGIFLSYASEDVDLANAFHKALTAIGALTYGGLLVFQDTSIRVGAELDQALREALQQSECLIVIYTATRKKSHSYTGVEIGYFQRLIDDERERSGTRRRIVTIYFDEKPAPVAGLIGIPLSISSDDLKIPRVDYLSKLEARRSAEKFSDPLTKFLKEVGRTAEERTRHSGLDPDEVERDREKRTRDIETVIVPAIHAATYECFGKRVAWRSIEQKLIEFEVESGTIEGAAIPPNARLTGHGGVFAVLGVGDRESSFTWDDFCNQLFRSAGSEAAPILRAISRVFESAVSSSTALDNEQLIRSPVDGKVYRIILTRHFDYFSGKKVLNMYFIERLQLYDYGDTRTSLLLSVINLTARYRFLFLEPQSELSELAFAMEQRPPYLRAKVQKLLRELLLIEEDSHVLELDTPTAVMAVFGPNADLTQVKNINFDWVNARDLLVRAAEMLLVIDSNAAEFYPAIEKWREALSAFATATREINTTVGTRALEALKTFYVSNAATSQRASSTGSTQPTGV